MKNRSMMKWRVRRDSRCNSIDHEDIRRSLEVLDSVLAEFDDSWTTGFPLLNGDDPVDYATPEIQRQSEENETDMTYDDGRSFPHGSFYGRKESTDGSTSQFYSLDSQEQSKVSSPPPIPKRSPATRLSDRNSRLFTFSSDNISLDSYDSVRSDAALSPKRTRCSRHQSET